MPRVRKIKSQHAQYHSKRLVANRRAAKFKGTVYHGTTQPPSLVKRVGLKRGSEAYREGKANTRAVFASDDKIHAASFGSKAGGQKAHVYSFKKRGTWHAEPYKPPVDNQYSLHKQRPTHVQQVTRTHENKMQFGHKWDLQKGSLPKHTSIQSSRPRAFTHTTPRFHASRRLHGH